MLSRIPGESSSDPGLKNMIAELSEAYTDVASAVMYTGCLSARGS